MSERLHGSRIAYKSSDFVIAGRSVASTSHPHRNEDTMSYSPDDHLAMVLDGSSGSKDGQKASRTAGAFLEERLKGQHQDPLRVSKEIRQALIDASTYVNKVAPDSRTTAVVVRIIDTNNGKFAVFGSVGDSRGYMTRDQRLLAVTKDHNLLDASNLSPGEKRKIATIVDSLDTKEDLDKLNNSNSLVLEFFENRNWVVQILGHEGNILPGKSDSQFTQTFRPDHKTRPRLYIKAVESGQRLLLTSDGIHDNLTAREIEDVITASKRYNAAFRLVKKALQRSQEWRHPRSTSDDVTAFVLDVK